MTCKDMGGVCEELIEGETADEMMKNGKEHVHGADDEAHKEVVKKMETITDEEMAEWKKGFEAKFDAAEEV